MQELKQGTPLQDGRYVIKRVLGQGGFGITYLAEQVSLGREVAVKEFFMKDNCMRDDASGAMTVPTTGSSIQVERYREKFLKEARTLASLDHPNIVSVIDVFEENGTVYYSMPYLPGGSLKGLINKKGPLSESEALRFAGQIAEALKYMHQERHICHYDVKPDNVLLDRKGNAVLIDFGISKNYDAQGNETSTTPVGMSEGYAPLEQYQQMVNEFSPASDVYALGATLYFMVTGTKPPTAISIVQGEALAFDSRVSQSAQNLIKRAMSVAAKNRPQDVDEFLHLSISTPADKSETQRSVNTEPKNQDVTIIASQQEPPSINNPVIKKLIDDMVPVLGGSFKMGANTLFYSDYRPKHSVTLSSFKICKYQVTQELWMAVMGNNPSKFTGHSLLPVENVSWVDCQRFIAELNRMTGLSFRLPTEAEWEYAACGGNKNSNHKYSGSDFVNSVAWYDNNSNRGSHRVGSKEPNRLGLFDMSGNVWEWCQDWYGAYTSDIENNPKGKEHGSHKVVRGGGWKSSSDNCRVILRGRFKPSHTDDDLGFRLAL